MYQVVNREITNSEREHLLGCMTTASSPFWPLHQYQYGLEIIGEAFGVAVLVFVLVGLGDVRLIHGLGGGAGALALWWALHFRSRVLVPLRRWKESNRQVWAFREAVEKAEFIRVHSVEAEAVVQVTYDEGAIWLFEVGPSETYWIDMVGMIPGQLPKAWPLSRFEVYEIPGWKGEIGPFGESKRLRPRKRYDFRDLFEHHEFEPPADGLIRSSLDTFVAEMRVRNQMMAKAT